MGYASYRRRRYRGGYKRRNYRPKRSYGRRASFAKRAGFTYNKSYPTSYFTKLISKAMKKKSTPEDFKLKHTKLYNVSAGYFKWFSNRKAEEQLRNGGAAVGGPWRKVVESEKTFVFGKDRGTKRPKVSFSDTASVASSGTTMSEVETVSSVSL